MPYYAGGGGTSVADDLTTAETDTALVLAPDGAGGVEFRAEVGGTGLVLEAHVTIASAEILTLQSVGVQIVAGVAAKAYMVLSAQLLYRFVTTAYTLAGDPSGLTVGVGFDTFVTFVEDILTETADQIEGETGATLDHVPLTDIEGLDIFIADQNLLGDPTLGDGTLEVWVQYRIFDV